MVQSSLRWRAGTTGLAALLAASAAAAPAPAKPAAPGAPGAKHTWAPADKHGFATARQLAGNAYLTLRQASASEVYYPDLSTPAFRSLQFAVSDGTSVRRETVEGDPAAIEPVAQGVSARVRPLAGSLGYRQVTETSRWKLTKTWITDPARAAVLVRVRFESKGGEPLRLFVLADPAPGDDGNDDRGRSQPHRLLAYDDDAASVVAARPALGQTTSGYKDRASDPWRQLVSTRGLTGYDARARGNVVQGARTRLTGVGRHQRMTLVIGFGDSPAAADRTASRSLAGGFGPAARRFAAGWRRYLRTVNAPPRPVASDPRLTRLYRQSVLLLAALEDKRDRGASIASPSMPWVWATLTLEKKEISAPYHLVWPRDFYHAATAQQAAGDEGAPRRMLDYLWRVQKPDGSFWQNTRVNGEAYWTGEQMDEVALPIVLAWWLGRTGEEDWSHVERAADYIVANGPETGQERWENQGGWSPNTIATEIAGLVCAADVARRHGAGAKAAAYEALADAWQRRVEDWTATDNGPYAPRPYYLRIVKGTDDDDATKDPDPNAGTTYGLGDNFPRDVDQREIVDPSFLGLVLFGVKPWDDPTVRNSLAVVDGATGERGLRVDTPSGEIWRRFTFDGYGEQRDGALWDIFPEARRQTLGRAWPLLSGERGEYELLAGRRADERLRTIANTANDGLMLPEQVWDGRPPTGRDGRGPAGTPSRSAAPLAWTHAQFIRLAWSIQAGEPVERPSIVACRYTRTDCGR
jgi:glucoamylase